MDIKISEIIANFYLTQTKINPKLYEFRIYDKIFLCKKETFYKRIILQIKRFIN